MQEISDDKISECITHVVNGVPGRGASFSNVHMFHLEPKNHWDIWENDQFLKDEKRCNAYFNSVCAFVRRHLKLMKERKESSLLPIH